jgi:hypothetical protein
VRGHVDRLELDLRMPTRRHAATITISYANLKPGGLFG